MRTTGTCEVSGAAGTGRRVGGRVLDAVLERRDEGGRVYGALVWDAGPGWRMVSSGVLGGGLGTRSFVLNAQVDGDYRRTDPARHLREIAASAGVGGDIGTASGGVGLLTAAEVRCAEDVSLGTDSGAEALVTAGLGRPTWAADDARLDEARLGASGAVLRPGTINVVVAVPAAMSDAALVNLATTTTEAKVQALMEAGYACTGTASDAVCVAVRSPGSSGAPGAETEFGGPRSRWGGRVARAVHAAVVEAAVRDSVR